MVLENHPVTIHPPYIVVIEATIMSYGHLDNPDLQSEPKHKTFTNKGH